jgi:iron complex transport system ATP-binding protein
VEEVVVMGRAPHLKLLAQPSAADYRKAGSAMAVVGITHLARRACTRLSGGEWQLTLLARALAQDPQILVLDEPTSHLDIGNQIKILKVIQSLAAGGLTIVMATHFPDHALWTANRVAMLNQGRIAVAGPPEEVITPATLGAVYGVDIKVLRIDEGTTSSICLPQL